METTVVRGDGISLLENRLTPQGPIDPASILALISGIITLIQGCSNPTPKALRKRLFNRSRLAVVTKQADPSLTWINAYAKADHIFDLADKAKDEELEAVIADARS